MARDFDGTNDNINYGTDASIDNFFSTGNAGTFAMWVERDAAAAAHALFNKTTTNAITAWAFRLNASDLAEFFHGFSTTFGQWSVASPTVGAAALTHLALTFDGLEASQPVIYINGTSAAVTEDTNSAGTATADGASSLRSGEVGSALTQDFDGRQGWLCYGSTIWTADLVNRHKWWGVAPGGPSTVAVWHPFWTDGLTNKGTATANGTATGTTVASLPRVERMWGSMMGCGR